MSAVLQDDTAKLIPIELIDEPAEAARDIMDETKLFELMGSIADIGQQQAGVVEERDGRYVIAAGHRRFLACRALGMTHYRATIAKPGDELREAIKVAENEFRESLNPADQALYFSRLLERYCSGDIEKLCAMVHQKESYVNTRLALLRGDPHVLQALKERKINLGVAEELNKFKHAGLRRSHLESAISGGATRAIVVRWRIEADQIAGYLPADGASSQEAADAASDVAPYTPRCEVCGETDPVYDLRYFQVHQGVCTKLFQGALAPFKQAQGEG